MRPSERQKRRNIDERGARADLALAENKKTAELKIYPGAPHGLTDAYPDGYTQINSQRVID
jgi:dienelactone hydrolase